MPTSDNATAESVVERRPRLLVPLTINFAVRYVVRTGLLERLRDVCDPVLALSWDDPDLRAELERDGWTTARLPDARVESPLLGLLHRDEIHFLHRLKSPSTRIDRSRRYVDRSWDIRIRRWATWQRDQLRARRPGDERQVLDAIEHQLAVHTNLAENQEFLAEHGIDAMLSVTPFTAQERVILWAAERAGLRTCASILSFDNITTRPPLPIAFDRYLVWNCFNRDEILRSYRGVTEDQVAIVGPAQFDFYADPSFVEDRATWRDRLGLGDAPTVLYGAGPPEVAPHEPQYVEHLCAAIDQGELPDDLRIVLRRHPVDGPERWEHLASHPAIAIDDPGRIGSDPSRRGQVDLGTAQIVDLCSALAHTDVHVSVSSTMTLDGAFFDKPQIGPAYDSIPDGRYRRMAADLYRREHFIPIVASGGLELSRSRDEMIAQVRGALDHPDRLARERRAMLEDLCTFTSGGSTERVATEIREFLASDQHRS